MAGAEKLKPAVLKKTLVKKKKFSTLSLFGIFGLPGLICRDENRNDLINEIVPKVKKIGLELWRKNSIYFLGNGVLLRKKKNQFLQCIASSPYQQFFGAKNKNAGLFFSGIFRRQLVACNFDGKNEAGIIVVLLFWFWGQFSPILNFVFPALWELQNKLPQHIKIKFKFVVTFKPEKPNCPNKRYHKTQNFLTFIFIINFVF